MRVATSQLYDRSLAQMTRLYADADAIQTSIGTEKRYAAPSASPAAYRQLRSLAAATEADGAFAANIRAAQATLDAGDAALGSIETQLQRALELATQAATGTLSDAQRTAMGSELDAVLTTILGLANDRGPDGQPLFGGTATEPPYRRAADGSIAYVGSAGAAQVPIGPDAQIETGVTGNRALGDIFAVLGTLAAAVRSGGDVHAAGSAALAGIQSSVASVATARASLGARSARLDVESQRLTDVGEARESQRAATEDTDIAGATIALQRTLTVLQATQASFSKLSGLSLFDYLR